MGGSKTSISPNWQCSLLTKIFKISLQLSRSCFVSKNKSTDLSGQLTDKNCSFFAISFFAEYFNTSE
jgi:hypothetical protein